MSSSVFARIKADAIVALRWIGRALEWVLALILLFEEWGWRPLAAAVGRLVRFAWWARFEAWLATLPPYAALVMFAAPSALLFPLKLAGLWLVAHGQFVAAVLLIGAAKLVGTALVARIFLITKPQLMTLGWFAWLYDYVVDWQEVIFARIRATWVWRMGRVLKWRVAGVARRIWAAYGPRVREVVRRLAERLGWVSR
jgi:hypothetical protein